MHFCIQLTLTHNIKILWAKKVFNCFYFVIIIHKLKATGIEPREVMRYPWKGGWGGRGPLGNDANAQEMVQEKNL